MSIRRKLILILVVIAVVPMLFVGTLGYYSAKQAIEDARIAALTSICDLKIKKIEDFFLERKKDILALQAYPEFKRAAHLFTKDPSGGFEPGDQALIKRVESLLADLQDAYHFTNASISAPDGNIIFAITGTEKAAASPNLSSRPSEAGLLQEEGIRISEVYLTGETCYPVAVKVTSPIESAHRDLAGWLSIEYDFTPIYESIQDVTGLGRTGEVLIAKRKSDNSAMLLDPLEEAPNTSIKHKINFGDNLDLPIQAALSGDNGHGLTRDHSGNEVLAAWRYLPLLDWGMVVKLDAAEAFKPTISLRIFFVLLMIAVILLSICLAAIVARSFSKPIHALQKSVEEIAKGNLNYKLGTVSKDEIGQLGNAFDRMTEKLKAVTASREELNNEISHRKQAEKDLNKTITRLDERVKELNCFFGISRLVEKRGQPLEAIFQGIVDLIPSALQYPERACAKITFDSREFRSPNFKPSPWQIVNRIYVNRHIVGELSVAYLKTSPERRQAPFIKEEHNLLKAISERVGKIIERREAQDGLEESEKRFRDLVENSLTGISIVQDNQVIYQNREQERILGPLPRPFILADLEKIHSGDVLKVKGFIEILGNGTTQTIETDFRYNPGHDAAGSRNMIWVNCRAISIKYRGKAALLVNIVDLTRAKELEKRLTIQDKMASLGRVAAGIAHEIRNPLSGINIYLDTLKKLHHKEGSEEKVETIIRQLNAASRKIESVIRRVMDFAKPSEPRLALIDINEPIGEAIQLTAVTMRKSGILMLKDLGEDLPAAYADRHLIEEMVLNLINNAAEAMRDSEDDKIIEVHSSVQGEDILIVVGDSGPGISTELKDKIFDPYLTTKSEGTGIGLSLCLRIVTDHGGTLKVDDSHLGGAEFRATMPLRKKQ